ncbi:MAG: hypothetical protein U0R49_11585 [Fimbriimonadales bacterium]
MSEISPGQYPAEGSTEGGAFSLACEDVSLFKHQGCTPQTIAELSQFYHDVVKRLYSVVQAENSLPAEILFEIHAAFDHVTRIHTFGEVESIAITKAYSHLKRSCLDIYKIYLRDSLDMYAELRRIETHYIDNGDFDFKLRHLVAEIRKKARHARRVEGDKRGDVDGKILAFDLWQDVANDCQTLRENFYFSPHVAWARKKNFWNGVKLVTIGVLASIIAAAIWQFIIVGQKHETNQRSQVSQSR